MKTIDQLETERLSLRRPQPDDLADLCRLYGDPKVGATLAGVRDAEQSRQNLDNMLAHWQRHGFGLWIMHDKSSGRFVGRGGLWNCHIADNDEIEVGYALVPEFWGRGLATELARASVRVGFEEMAVSELISFTLPTNLASRRVMEKAGFIYQRDFVYKDLPHVLYRQKRIERDRV